MAVEDRPSLIVLRSHIGYPSPEHTDDPAAHGYAIKGADELRDQGGPGHARRAVLGARRRGRLLPPVRPTWTGEAGGLAGPPRRLVRRPGRDRCVPRPARGSQVGRTSCRPWPSATWSPPGCASGQCLERVRDVVPGLIGGGADLTGNTGTELKGATIQAFDSPSGRQIHFGVREHAMGGVMNGMALHGGILPVGGTFLVFSDYMRGAVRLSALSEAKVIFSWTHDSVGVGEDGPTHQPIEHLAALRAMPGLRVIRPADANETAEAWRVAVDARRPHRPDPEPPEPPGARRHRRHRRWPRAAYVLHEPAGHPQVVLVGTGSEVWLCRDAADLLAEQGIAARVVSLPCWELFAAPGRRLPRRGAPGGGPDAVGRGRRHVRLAAVPTTPSASTASGPAPPARWCSRSSASPPTTWSNAPWPCSRPPPEPTSAIRRPSGERRPGHRARLDPHLRPTSIAPPERPHR